MAASLPVRQRRAARVLLFDEADRVLLLRFEMDDPGLPQSFWAAPGGGLEAGETPIEAARRELLEELRVEIELGGPVHGEHAEWTEGVRRVLSDDSFFVGRCEASAPVLAGESEAERRVLREMRWWTAGEIDCSAETIFPRNLAQLVRRLLQP